MKKEISLSALTAKEEQDLRTLAAFIACWCKIQHPLLPKESTDFSGLSSCRLCPDCRELLAYAIARRCACPLQPKPACKVCPVHCYQPQRRVAIREIMRFSGRYLLLRGRLDLLWHYFF